MIPAHPWYYYCTTSVRARVRARGVCGCHNREFSVVVEKLEAALFVSVSRVLSSEVLYYYCSKTSGKLLANFNVHDHR